MAEPEFLTAEEVAKHLRRHPVTMRLILAKGLIPGARRAGKRWLVPRAGVRAYVESLPAPAPLAR